MTLIVPDVGEVELLTDLLGNGENFTLKLFTNDVTPAESDTAGTYTEASFTGYSAKTLTRSISGATWATPSTSTGTTSSEYNSGTPQSWTMGDAGPVTVYGYFVIGATSTVLQWAERFASSRALSLNDVLNLTPRMELD